MVRVGIGLYGIEPAPGVGTSLGLRPALAWRSVVTGSRWLVAGERISYGQRYELGQDSWIATVPVGYADGYPGSLSSTGHVLIGGRRCLVAGNVTMDQLMADCGDLEPSQGDEVVLVGSQAELPFRRSSWPARRHDRVRDREPCRCPRPPSVRAVRRRVAAIGAGVAAGVVAAGAVTRTVIRRRTGTPPGSRLWDLPPDDLGQIESFDGTRIAVRAAGDPGAPTCSSSTGSAGHDDLARAMDGSGGRFSLCADGHRGHGPAVRLPTATSRFARWAATSPPCSTWWRRRARAW